MESPGIIIPLRNMINEAYALDIGRKIRAQQRQAMKDGKFIGARTPYGYLKRRTFATSLSSTPLPPLWYSGCSGGLLRALA